MENFSKPPESTNVVSMPMVPPPLTLNRDLSTS